MRRLSAMDFLRVCVEALFWISIFLEPFMNPHQPLHLRLAAFHLFPLLGRLVTNHIRLNRRIWIEKRGVFCETPLELGM